MNLDLPDNVTPLVFAKGGAPSQKPDIRAHVSASLMLGLPELQVETFHDGSLILVGGGPSLRDQESVIRDLASLPGSRIIAIKDAHDWLIERGIVPWGAVHGEVCAKFPRFIDHPHPDVTYLVASHCHPNGFDRLINAGGNILLWHCQALAGEEPIIYRRDKAEGRKPSIMVSGASVVALRTISIGLGMGFRDFHLVGYDACWGPQGQSHAYYDRPHETFEVYCAGRWFRTNAVMARKARDFGLLMRRNGHLFTLKTYGDGLIQHIHRTLYPQVYECRSAA